MTPNQAHRRWKVRWEGPSRQGKSHNPVHRKEAHVVCGEIVDNSVSLQNKI